MTTANRIGAETRFSVAPSVYARVFGTELVLLDFGRGEYFGLDEIGALIWRELERAAPLGAIAGVVAARYEIGVEDALRDIVDLVTQMHDIGLVVRAA